MRQRMNNWIVNYMFLKPCFFPMTTKVFKAQRFAYLLWYSRGTYRSLLNRSGICDELTVVIFFCSCSRFDYKTAFNLVKIHLLFRIIPLIQWSVMFCRPCFNLFLRLKYVPRLFSEYMLTFRAEEPMKICVTNWIRNIYILYIKK